MSILQSVRLACGPRVFLFGALLGVAGAAYADEVVLLSNDGSTKITGNLLGFDGQNYEIETVFGVLFAPGDAVQCTGVGCPVEQITYRWGDPVIGEEVTIIIAEGAIRLTGMLTSYADGQAVISTQIGSIPVSMDAVECTGPGCPPRIEVINFVMPDGAVTTAAKEPIAQVAVAEVAVLPEKVEDHQDHSGHVMPVSAQVSDTFYPESGLDTPYEIEPEIRMAGPGEVVEILMPIALENYAWRHDGMLDLFDDHMAHTEDIGELKHHAAGVGFEIQDAAGERIMGLLGHHAHDPYEQINMLANGETDVAFVTGPISEQEIEIVANAGFGDLTNIDQQRVVAVDGYVAVVSPENPVDRIALDDLQKVFAGQITNWSQVGGPDAPINVYTFRVGHETFYKTRDVLLAPAGLEVSPNTIEKRLTRDIIDGVLADPNGIGFVSYARSRGTKPLSLVMQCGLEIDASPLTIKTERYPLVQRMAAFNRIGEQPELVSDFLNFIESNDFDAGVEKAGFVSLGIETTPLQDDAESFAKQVESFTNATEIRRAQEVMALMDDRSSLTAAFRFRIGSAGLDQRAQRDLRRVADFIAENPDAEYTVVGFADTTGGFPQNELLSLRRARTVVDALRAADPSGRVGSIDLPAVGGGELNAVACNDTEAERATNRRVEIWMKR